MDKLSCVRKSKIASLMALNKNYIQKSENWKIFSSHIVLTHNKYVHTGIFQMPGIYWRHWANVIKNESTDEPYFCVRETNQKRKVRHELPRNTEACSEYCKNVLEKRKSNELFEYL